MTDDKRKDERPETEDERLDEGLDDTFPASDPPSTARPPKPGRKDRKESKD